MIGKGTVEKKQEGSLIQIIIVRLCFVNVEDESHALACIQDVSHYHASTNQYRYWSLHFIIVQSPYSCIQLHDIRRHNSSHLQPRLPHPHCRLMAHTTVKGQLCQDIQLLP